MNSRLWTISISLVALIWVTPLKAQEDEASVNDDTRNCLPTRSIRRIRIIDDQNVLIYLSARKIFHNVLRKRCLGLERLGGFSYNSSDGQMCDGDSIGAMNNDAWGDVRPMPGCRLGVHQRITKDQADEMREVKKNGPKIEPRSLPLPEPSEVGTDNEDPES